MKKNLIILASTLLLIGGLTSCQKQHTCECTAKDGGAKSTFLTKKSTKKEATEVCEAGIPNNDCKLAD